MGRRIGIVTGFFWSELGGGGGGGVPRGDRSSIFRKQLKDISQDSISNYFEKSKISKSYKNNVNFIVSKRSAKNQKKKKKKMKTKILFLFLSILKLTFYIGVFC